jgi:hypothetical protein
MGEQQNRPTASPNQRGRNEYPPVRPPTRERWSDERTRDPPNAPIAKTRPMEAGDIMSVRDAYSTNTARTALQEKFQTADQMANVRRMG